MEINFELVHGIHLKCVRGSQSLIILVIFVVSVKVVLILRLIGFVHSLKMSVSSEGGSTHLGLDGGNLGLDLVHVGLHFLHGSRHD